MDVSRVELQRRRLERFSPRDDTVPSAPSVELKDEKAGVCTEECAPQSIPVSGDEQEEEEEEEEDAIPSEFECVLCLRLYYDPVSLPCGHTYCRDCLRRALNTKLKCPMCRAPCHMGAGDAGTNLALVGIIVSQFKEPYEARRKEAHMDARMEAELCRKAATLGEDVTAAPDGTVSMPVCLLDVLLFPHQPITLYLFERRYVTLVDRCLSGTRRFAVFRERSPGSGAVGAVVQIEDARVMGGGQYLISCKGVGRCVVSGSLEEEEGTNGLNYARVLPFEDEDEVAGSPPEGGAGGGGDGDGAGRGDGAGEVLSEELRQMADQTAALIGSFVAQLSSRQRAGLIRRCGEPPKEGNSSLSHYRRLSFWLPSALALGGGAEGRERRVAMFGSRSLPRRLAEACEAVTGSEAVVGATARRRERGTRRLFDLGRRAPLLLSSTCSSVLLVVGIFTALYVWNRHRE